ncbi:hypothetical protein HHL16_02560 [Pseudoflavitalea sp. G-6-1-2]|uniref:hypothetical protein n=1 Tax=Pseudoflavitalea sp. G-6-1-2 TaxID=2728841 RepID=UPI00146AFF20|nr:hypothetical protein [Pseudoflavitalea sp. G-6-1-2]NML19734.1 hypothetical protein [Pseudoflavitalea sp. G-6-1-2]
MNPYKKTKFFNKPVRLSKKQRKDPAAVLKEFFTWYHLDDLRSMLWQWLEAGIATDAAQFESARDRSNLLFFYRNVELLAEAAYMMVREELPATFKKQAKKKTASSN